MVTIIWLSVNFGKKIIFPLSFRFCSTWLRSTLRASQKNNFTKKKICFLLILFCVCTEQWAKWEFRTLTISQISPQTQTQRDSLQRVMIDYYVICVVLLLVENFVYYFGFALQKHPLFSEDYTWLMRFVNRTMDFTRFAIDNWKDAIPCKKHSNVTTTLINGTAVPSTFSNSLSEGINSLWIDVCYAGLTQSMNLWHFQLLAYGF